MVRHFPFVWVDVFARTPLEGNQLAVFPDARGLSDEEMQSIARETHLSETTFVFPSTEATDREKGFRTRIFAVSGEMPFAGHPTLGTASVLGERIHLTDVALLLQVGKVPVHFSLQDGHRFGEMVQPEPVLGQTHDREAVARALGVGPGDLDPAHPVRTVSTGVPFAIVPFCSLETLSQVHPNWTRMEEYLRGTDAKFFYFVSRETRNPSSTLHARMIFSGGEDPATGSAAGPAVAWAVSEGIVAPNHPTVIEQGFEVARPSRIHCRADLRDGAPSNVRVGGHVVTVIRGELDL